MKTREESKSETRTRDTVFIFISKEVVSRASSYPALGQAREGSRARIAAARPYRTPTPFHGRWRTLLSRGVGGWCIIKGGQTMASVSRV